MVGICSLFRNFKEGETRTTRSKVVGATVLSEVDEIKMKISSNHEIICESQWLGAVSFGSCTGSFSLIGPNLVSYCDCMDLNMNLEPGNHRLDILV